VNFVGAVNFEILLQMLAEGLEMQEDAHQMLRMLEMMRIPFLLLVLLM